MKAKIKNGELHVTVEEGDEVENPRGVKMIYEGKGVTFVKTLAASDLSRLNEVK